MAFRFSLTAVLKYREDLEHREFLALEKLQNAVALAERKVVQIDEMFSTAEEHRKRELADGICGADLKSAYDYRVALEQQRQVLLARLQEAKLQWQRQLQSYQAARRSRETLENLRSQQLEAYTRAKAKQEQSALDDLFLSRRGRRQ